MKDELVKALQRVAYLEDVKTEDDDEPELIVGGKTLDSQLLLLTMASMLEAGDLKIEVVSDTLGKEAYFNKLIAAIK